jgi:hypothetical protein
MDGLPDGVQPQGKRQRRLTEAAAQQAITNQTKEEEAKTLTGRIISKQRKTVDGNTFMVYGTVYYLGADHKPYPFEINYTDGSKERLTKRQINNYLQPLGTTLPAVNGQPPLESAVVASRTSAPAIPSSPRRSSRLRPAASAMLTLYQPWTFDFSTAHGIKTAMQKIMVGSWTVGLVNNILDSYQQYISLPHPFSPLQISEVKPLLAAIDFSFTLHTLDPWSYVNCPIATVLTQAEHVHHTNDFHSSSAADYHLDPLQPGSYQQFNQHLGINAIISSPWSALADPALALAVNWATTVVCLHVPRTFVTNAHISHPPRLALLKQFQQAGRLMCITDLPSASDGQRYAWLIIFATAQFKNLMVRPEFRELSLSCILGS